MFICVGLARPLPQGGCSGGILKQQFLRRVGRTHVVHCLDSCFVSCAWTHRYNTNLKVVGHLQGGPLLVMNGVITLINGLING